MQFQIFNYIPTKLNNFELLKKCPQCKVYKKANFFNKDKSKKYGLSGACKDCNKKRRKIYYAQNTDAIKERSKKWRENNPETYKKAYQSYNENNRERQKEYSKRWYHENKERAKETCRKWCQENKEYLKEYRKQYLQQHAEYFREWERNYRRERRKNKSVRLRYTMRDFLKRTMVNPKSDTTYNILGYTKEDLQKRLEHNFTSGMDWENYGSVWNIDHTIPISHFIAKGEERPWIINALSNLKPIWVGDNSRKKNKYPYTKD